ncbi:DUF6236 family protein [Plantactinospora sp. CA-294935]|uniref:DUF6236 family protein n=1 Tax=Plantactinospora sp. CA-294935 TaxID=3240012 RepID=UPI003D8CDFCE
MSTYLGLYYPFIHFRDEAWLKLTSLYWDGMGRIVPAGYSLRDSGTVREFKDGGYIRDWRPSSQAEPAREFREMLDACGERLALRYGVSLSESWPDDPATVNSHAAHFGNPKLAYIFGPKISPELVDDLEVLGLAQRGGRHDPYWIGMHPRLAAMYMTALANAMGNRRKAQPVSDDMYSHVAIGDLSVHEMAETLLADRESDIRPSSPEGAEHLMVGLTLKMVVPSHIDKISPRKLLDFRARYPSERAAFQTQIQDMVATLQANSIADPDALRDHLQIQYEKVLQPSLADLKHRLRDARVDTTTGLTNIKVSLPAGTAGLMMLGGAKSLFVAGPIALSVWEIWRGYRQQREALLRERPATSYLYKLGNDLRPQDLASRITRLGRRTVPPRSVT